MLRFVIRTCDARNIPVAIHLQSVELTTKWIKEGMRFVLHLTDTGAMHAGFRRNFEELRQVVSEIQGQSTDRIEESDEVI